MRPAALSTLSKIMADEDVAPQHRVAAAKVVLSECRASADPTTGKDISEMDGDELKAALGRVNAALARQDAEEAETIEPVGDDLFG